MKGRDRPRAKSLGVIRITPREDLKDTRCTARKSIHDLRIDGETRNRRLSIDFDDEKNCAPVNLWKDKSRITNAERHIIDDARRNKDGEKEGDDSRQSSSVIVEKKTDTLGAWDGIFATTGIAEMLEEQRAKQRVLFLKNATQKWRKESAKRQAVIEQVGTYSICNRRESIGADIGLFSSLTRVAPVTLSSHARRYPPVKPRVCIRHMILNLPVEMRQKQRELHKKTKAIELGAKNPITVKPPSVDPIRKPSLAVNRNSLQDKVDRFCGKKPHTHTTVEGSKLPWPSSGGPMKQTVTFNDTLNKMMAAQRPNSTPRGFRASRM